MQNLFYIFCVSVMLSVAAVPTHAVESYGNPEDPVVAEVLGMQIRTKDPAEMQSVIGAKIFHEYAKQNKIVASQKDIDRYMALIAKFMRDDRKKRDARRVEIQQQLKTGSLPAERTKHLQSELATLEDLHKEALAEDSGSKQEKEEILKVQQATAKSIIEQWMINKALYHQYGGRIIHQQTGPDPIDAVYDFLKEQQKKEAFKILNKSFDEFFWEYFANENKHCFYEHGSQEERRAFDKAPWQEEQSRGKQ
ncbi:MAG: hypothetical protein U9R57_08635 [Thermodesulfobacteriota bacterium]|nr:hypothetical protein [Thermodesulfobacteriota bacterium]